MTALTDIPDAQSLRIMREKVQGQANAERTKVQRHQVDKDDPYTVDSPSSLPQDFIRKCLTSEHDGDAALFARIHRDRRIFDHSEGCWHIYQGQCWERDTVGEALADVQDVIEAYETEAARCAWLLQKTGISAEQKEVLQRLEKALRTHVVALQKLDRKRAVLTLAAAGKRGLSTAGDAWDSQPMLLPCANGVLDLQTGKLRDGMPSDMLRTSSPTVWPGLDVQEPPIFAQFLGNIFNGDAELIAYIQRLLGYSVTGMVSDHVFPIFWGNGRNGKGTLLETLQFVLGPLAGPVKSELLLDQGRARASGSPDADLMTLRGKRFVWASETDEGRKLSASRVKWLVGGDTIVARPPFGRREISFRPTHKLLMLTNHKPRVDAADFALWQRIHLVPFEDCQRKLTPFLSEN